MSHFKDLARKTRTIPKFLKGEKIPEYLIQDALEISLLAPNHKLTFPWKFYWLKGEARIRFADMLVRLKGEGNEAKEHNIRENFSSMSDILFFSQKLEGDERRIKEDYATLCCSVQLFALALAEHGIGYKWSTSPIIKERSLFDFLGIEWGSEEIVGMIYVGKSSSEIPHRRRPELKEVLKIVE